MTTAGRYLDMLALHPAKSLALIGLILIAGCLGTGSTVDDDTSPSVSTPPTESNWSDEGEPRLSTDRFLNLSIGDESTLPEQYAHHYYLIGNNATEPRSMTIAVWRNSTVVLNRTIEFPANGVLMIDVLKPGEYTLVIDPEGSPRHVIDAPDEWDCNYRAIEAAVQPDGQLYAFTLKSLVEC